MTLHSHYPRPHQQRRAKAVYGSLRTRRPMIGLIAVELGVLALFALGAAGVLALRAWSAIGN